MRAMPLPLLRMLLAMQQVAHRRLLVTAMMQPRAPLTTRLPPAAWLRMRLPHRLVPPGKRRRMLWPTWLTRCVHCLFSIDLEPEEMAFLVVCIALRTCQ